MARRRAPRADQPLLPGMSDGPAPSTDDPSPDGDALASPAPGDHEPQPAPLEAGRAVVAAGPAVEAPTAAVESEDSRVSDPAPPCQTMEPRETVYVIDSNALIFQVFHAVPEMTSPSGEPVNAVYGFTGDMLNLLESRRPTYLFCAFDLPGPTFRHEMYEGYKAHRAEMPDELRPQFPSIRRVLEAMGIPILEVPGYEADDILATVARLAEGQGRDCYLVTNDKDCRQLITPRVKLLNVRKGLVYDEAALEADWGIRPEQVVDFQALVGDSVDAVPGIKSIGAKTATELLRQFGTLDAVLDRAHEVPQPKRRQVLQEGREMALLSRRLVRLEACVPLELDWERGRAARFPLRRAEAVFKEMGFHRFRERVGGLDEPPPTVDWKSNYRCVDSDEALADLVRLLSSQTRISVDTETTSVRPTEADLVGYSFAWAPGEACYVPVRAPAGEKHIDPQVASAALRPVLENPAIAKIGQNLKYDMIVLRSERIELANVAFDTMVASYLLEAGERNHNLDELAVRYLKHENIKISELIGSGKQQKRMDEVPLEQVTAYAAEDADVPFRLAPMLESQLRQEGLGELFETLEMPLVEVLATMEQQGITVDVPLLRDLSARYGVRLAALEEEIYQLAGHRFNIASRLQLQEVLFTELKLPVQARTKTGPSTDVDVLEVLAKQHALPARIIEHRQFTKLKNTYVDALPELVNPRTGRVHASFHQAVAATGRLSSSDPNLQNIPIRGESGREIRAAFLPGPPGWKLLSADYSQIELRVLAHFSSDEALCAAFANDEDVHTRVASEVNEVSPSEVTAEMRRNAKAVNFGVIYGQSAFGLAKSLDISQEQAAKFIDAYFARYRGVDDFLTKTLEECSAKGYVKTVLGRRRAIRGIRAGAGRQRNLPERTAINTVIQGSAADLIKLAMVAVHRRLRRENLATRLLLQIHDELVFEVPPHEIQYLARLVSDEMVGAYALAVPLKVDVKVGSTWADTKPVS